MPLPCRLPLLAVLLAAAAAMPASASAASLSLASTTHPPPGSNVPFTSSGTADAPSHVAYLADPGTSCAATYREESTRQNLRGMNGQDVAAGSFAFDNPGVPGRT